MTSGVPDALEPPALVRALASGRRLAAVWLNELGGSTWRLEPDKRSAAPAQHCVGKQGTSDGVTYLKVGPLGPEFDPQQDAERLRWLRQHVAVPQPVSTGTRDGWGWLETLALDGWMVIPSPLRPEAFDGRDLDAVSALGRALRLFHESVPAGGCPYSWTVEARLRRCSDAERARLSAAPPMGDDLVVCHGDACSPNFLLGADLEVSGYVDLGRCGLADRWADLAPAVMSAGWNFGEDAARHLLAGYGIGDDLPMRPDKLDFYCAVWNAASSD